MTDPFKKGYGALDVGRSRAYALIQQLSAEMPTGWLCEAFNVTRSSYYAHRRKRLTPNVDRIRLRHRVKDLFTQSRSIVSLVRKDGEHIGRFRVRTLMRELGLISKQPLTNQQPSNDQAYRMLALHRKGGTTDIH